MTGQQAVESVPVVAYPALRFRFDARRWTPPEVITVGLSLLLLHFVTRPWYDIRLAACPPPQIGGSCQITQLASVSGKDAHGYLWITILPVIAIVAVLILRAGFGHVPFLTWPDDKQVLAGAASLNFVIVAAAFLTKSASVTVHPNLQFVGVSVTWESAAFVALVISAAAAGAAILNLHPRAAQWQQAASRMLTRRTARHPRLPDPD
jgi:hypothetical protein